MTVLVLAEDGKFGESKSSWRMLKSDALRFTQRDEKFLRVELWVINKVQVVSQDRLMFERFTMLVIHSLSIFTSLF